jgi:HisJ family histidinol phosphate phosphatase
LSDNNEPDPRLYAIPDIHGHAKGEHKPYTEERPLPLTARMLFLWFYHACRRGYPRFLMVADHMNYLTFEDPAAVNLVRRALKLAQAGDLYGAAETANVDVGHAAVVSEGLRRGMRYSIGAEVDNDPRSRPDAQNIVDAMRPDGIIRSVHFLPITHPVHGDNWPWPFDNPEFQELFDVVGVERTWELYINALVDAIERLPGHIVGHFFVPAVFGHWPDDAKLDAYENRVLDAAEARGMAIEFNTRFFYRDHSNEEKDRYLDANQRLLRKAKARGVQIAIGSDAHSPKDQGGAFEVVLHVLDALDINEIVFPLGGQLRRVALRVFREPEPEPVPEAPAPEPQPVAQAAAEPARPVRKARATAASTRPASTSPERPQERSESSAAAAEAPPEPPPKAAPKRKETPSTPAAEPVTPPAPKPPAKAAKAAPVKPPAAAKTPAKAAPVAKPPPPKAAAKPPARPKPAAPKPPAPKPPAPKPPAPKPPAPKAAAKAAAQKAAPVKKAAKAAPPARATAKKAAPARKSAPAKKAAPAKKPVPAKKAVHAKKAGPAKKVAPAKKAAPAKKPVKKAAPARPVPKRAAPKKPATRKPAAARSAPARKSAAAKKTTAKKTAPKRR